VIETNYTLEHLDISHEGLHFSAPVSGISDLLRLGNHKDCPHMLTQQYKGGDSLDLHLSLTQDGFRRYLLLEGNDKNQGHGDDTTYNMTLLWYKTIQHYPHATTSLFALLQGCPSALSELAESN
jgi:hypothetical protein